MSDPENLSRKIEIRRFRLRRNEDESGVSGVGYVAEGVQFTDGTCVLHWLTTTTCTAIYHSTVEMIHIHGHEGKTEIEWIDQDPKLPTETPKKKKSTKR